VEQIPEFLDVLYDMGNGKTLPNQAHVGSKGRIDMSVYMIIDSKVKDKEKYGQYIEQVAPIVTRFGGRYHVRGDNIRAFGSWKPERIIVIEFPSESHVQDWLTSPEYKAIAPLREASADAQAILVDACTDE
jgi:Uncharacterized conserved protein